MSQDMVEESFLPEVLNAGCRSSDCADCAPESTNPDSQLKLVISAHKGVHMIRHDHIPSDFDAAELDPLQTVCS
jgi:hypothetical protein